MTLGVSTVRSWRPDDLRLTADQLDALVDKLDDRMKGLLTEQDVLAERWSGDAARAAAARVVRERALGSAIAEALPQSDSPQGSSRVPLPRTPRRNLRSGCGSKPT